MIKQMTDLIWAN